MKYRKKPVVIEAWEWDESLKTLSTIGCDYWSYAGHESDPDLVYDLRISSLDGAMNVSKGDFIIKRAEGEFYPCKPDIFKQTYELVLEERVFKEYNGENNE